MEQYEQKKLLEYLINLLDCIASSIRYDIHTIKKILKDAALYTDKEVPKLTEENLLEKIKELYSKFENDYEKSQIQLFIDNLAQLYNINKNEEDIFNLYIRMNLPMFYRKIRRLTRASTIYMNVH